MNPTTQPDGGKLTPLVATLNLRGQTKMHLSKLLQLEELLKTIKPAVIFFQESQLQNNSFENCPFINCNYQLLINNSPTGYGTGALINNSLKVDNVKALPGGRILYFEIHKTSFVNVYLPSGTAAEGTENRSSATLFQTSF